MQEVSLFAGLHPLITLVDLEAAVIRLLNTSGKG